MSDNPEPGTGVEELIDDLETHAALPVASAFTEDCTALTWDCG
ncbi:hypothetical protein [Nonomuraea soli]|uniref:Uncharacterized protein n=1 Tax=Nonomuraea soli TaxID=1032476 RepID=A0A7W0HQW8_9ACTN|nr:hypothetical protein [Nonomuraea soli]MBA2892315.1 hypothetical protein [Nonomuraea soli]